MSNVPVPLTTFVGRVAELAALAEVLRDARVVTVAGPGGCGKTRLAIAAAHEYDGVRWVDLAATRDPATVPELVAEAIGALLVPGSPLREVAGVRLVCLDNCEHVLGAAADMAVALAQAGVTVLATSREPLGIPGEVVWRVPPLSGTDAVTLFRERANAEESAELRTACARLDGIPLAIELAAAWSSTLSVPEILRGLDDRFALLVRGPRGVAARQATLAASMAWSHDLLDDADRVLFRRLGVFAGGFTRASAEAVCGGDVLGGLRRLVDKSLVIADTRGTVTRYRMLETVRQYAVSRLAASDEETTVRDRHLAAMLALVEAVAPLLDEDKDAWRAGVETEQENLRTALEWGLASADPSAARRLAAGLPWLWHLNRHGLEGLALLRKAIDARPDARDALQARLLTGLALVADTAQPIGLEYDAAQAAYEIATEAGDTATASLARLLSAVGVFYRDFDTAWSLASEARAGGTGFVADGAVALLGIIQHLRDEHESAMPLLREAIDGLSRRGDRGVASTALGFLAGSVLYTGDVAGARTLAEESVRMARPLADYHRIGSATAVLATVEMADGRLDAAAAVLEPVVRLVTDAEHAPFVPGLARAVGRLRLLTGAVDEAVEWFTRESAWLDGGGDVYLAPETLTGMAAALRARGSVDEARDACDRALEMARRIGMPRLVADALSESASLDPAQAVELQHEALAIRAAHGLWLCCEDSLRALAELTGDRVLTEETDLRTRVEYARRARGKRGRPSSGWASLTPAEQSVVRLAADGLSNPDIGTRLFMSRSTVKTHLSHVYAKLGVTNRTELANLAAHHLMP